VHKGSNRRKYQKEFRKEVLILQKLGVHEKLELHELLTFKTTCITKTQTMLPLVSDSNLKNILQQDISCGTQDIQQLRNLLV
jgi:similar to spore coat protein